MLAPSRPLLYRQFMHGLSRGITVMAIAGVFWLLLAGWAADCLRSGITPVLTEDVPAHYLLWEPWPVVVIGVVIFYWARRIRSKAAGFRYSEVRSSTEEHRKLTRSMTRNFLLALLGEGALCCLSAFLCLRFHREDLIWMGVGFAVSVHLIPLGWTFRIQSYTIAGIIGTITSLAALMIPDGTMSPAARLAMLGIVLGASMWLAATRVVFCAEKLETAWESANFAIGMTPAGSDGPSPHLDSKVSE